MPAQQDTEPHVSVTRLLEQLQAPILLFDHEPRLRFANDAAHAALPSLGLRPDPALLLLLKRARASGAPVSVHALRLAGAGDRFDAALSPLPEPAGWTVVELAAAQPAWQSGETLLEQHGAVSSLLRGLQHELRNPLAGIRGAAQLLAQDEDGSDREECARIIQRECDRLMRLLSGLGEPGPFRPAPVNIHAVLERVIELLGAEFGEQALLERDYDPSLPALSGDADALNQLLLNLGRNALQAGAGRVRFRTRLARDVHIGATRHQRTLRLTVTDDGPGIPEALQPVLFYPMVSGREGGSGLGLAIAQSIAIRHDGLLSFDSSPGETCFTLLLPMPEAVR